MYKKKVSYRIFLFEYFTRLFIIVNSNALLIAICMYNSNKCKPPCLNLKVGIFYAFSRFKPHIFLFFFFTCTELALVECIITNKCLIWTHQNIVCTMCYFISKTLIKLRVKLCEKNIHF